MLSIRSPCFSKSYFIIISIVGYIIIILILYCSFKTFKIIYTFYKLCRKYNEIKLSIAECEQSELSNKMEVSWNRDKTKIIAHYSYFFQGLDISKPFYLFSNLIPIC